MAKLIQVYKGYEIKSLRDGGHIVCHGKQHAHINGVNNCRLLIDMVTRKEVPKKKYMIKAALRLCRCMDYQAELCKELHKWDGLKDCMSKGFGIHGDCRGRY